MGETLSHSSHIQHYDNLMRELSEDDALGMVERDETKQTRKMNRPNPTRTQQHLKTERRSVRCTLLPDV